MAARAWPLQHPIPALGAAAPRKEVARVGVKRDSNAICDMDVATDEVRVGEGLCPFDEIQDLVGPTEKVMAGPRAEQDCAATGAGWAAAKASGIG
jgi:hypothetical protein